MLSTLARRVARAIRRRALWGPDDRIAVAVSGGADSVALTLALAELSAHADWALVGLIHVNHNLRGDESAEDEAFCRALADRLALPIDVVSVDLAPRRAERRVSLEAAAREARYEALAAAARRLSATVVATGHTRDDQAETVLLRLLRGSSTRGVSAIRARRGAIARPLLDERRADLVKYLGDRGEPHRDDSSNHDQAIPRNRLRHALVPVIDGLWPGGVTALARFADLSTDDEAWLARAAARARGRVVQTDADGVQLDRARLGRLPRALGRRVVRDVIEQAGGRPTFAHVEAVLRLARSDKPKGRLDLQGVVAEFAPDRIGIWPETRASSTVSTLFSYPLQVPGEVTLGETGSVLLASLKETGPLVPPRSAGPLAALQADRVRLPLTVRTRRPGDRLRPLGAPGSRKVQDLLVDRKVPCADRDRVPIVEDADGRIVWVAGVAVADRARVTRPEAGMVILEIKKDRA